MKNPLKTIQVPLNGSPQWRSFLVVLGLVVAFHPGAAVAASTSVYLVGAAGASDYSGDGGVGGDAVTLVGSQDVAGDTSAPGIFRVVGGQGGAAL